MQPEYLPALHQRQEIVDRFRRFDVPHGARSLFDAIAKAGHRDGFTWELQTRFAAALGVTDRTVRRWETLLERAGLVLRGRVSLYGNGLAGGTRRLLWPVRVDPRTRRLLVPLPSVGHARRVLCERIQGFRAWMLKLRVCGERVENRSNRPCGPSQTIRTSLSGTPSELLSQREKYTEPINPSGLRKLGEFAATMVARLQALAVGPVSIPGAVT